MPVDTGQINLKLNADAQQAVTNLGKVTQKFDQMSKSAKEAAKHSKDMAGFGKGFGAQASGMLGQFGLGGITLGSGLGTALGSGLFAISELIINKMGESNRKLIEGIQRGDAKAKTEVETAKGIKGLSQQDVMDISSSFNVSVGAIKAVANELGAKKFADKSKWGNLKPLLTSVDFAMNNGSYREGLAKEFSRMPIDPRTPNEALKRASGWVGRPGRYSYSDLGYQRLATYAISDIRQQNENYVEQKSAEQLRTSIADMLEGGIEKAYDRAAVELGQTYSMPGPRAILQGEAIKKFREYQSDPTKLLGEGWWSKQTMDPVLRQLVNSMQDVSASNREMLKIEANTRFTYQSSETTGDGK